MTARRLLRLTSQPTQSATFGNEAQILSAALSDRGEDGAITATDIYTASYIGRAAARRRKDLVAQLYYLLTQQGVSRIILRRDRPLAAAASLFAQNTSQISQAVLSHTASRLAEGESESEYAEDDYAAELVPGMPPSYLRADISAYLKPAALRTRGLICVCYLAANTRRSGTVLRQQMDLLAEERGEDEHLLILSPLLQQLDESARYQLLSWEEQRPYGVPGLARVADAHFGVKEPRQWEPVLDELVSKQNRQYYRLAWLITIALARRCPAETLQLIGQPDLPRFSEWVELAGEDLIIELLSSVALVDTERAVDGALELCRKRPVDAAGRDALHAVAVAV